MRNTQLPDARAQPHAEADASRPALECATHACPSRTIRRRRLLMRANAFGRAPFVSSVELLAEKVPGFERYPFNIPAIVALRDRVRLDPRATILVGENGSGKSTLIEALAVAAGFNAEGGSNNFQFSTRPSESSVPRYLRLARSERRPRTGFFLRVESFFNVATSIEELDRVPAPAPPGID
jgi:hypothetical protein